MKNLTIKRLTGEVKSEDLIFLTNSFNRPIPIYFTDFIINFGGKKVVENCFLSENMEYLITNFLPITDNRNASIRLILPAVRNKEEGIGRDDLIPFAIDPGGNPFYFSIGENDYEVIYIDRLGAGYENPLLKISNTFEEFIDGLQPENEII